MYDATIKSLLSKVNIIPGVLLEKYLAKMFNISVPAAKQAIYSAMKRGVGFLVEPYYIAKRPGIKFESNRAKMAQAVRVYMEFLPEAGTFIPGNGPWIISFISDSQLIQVCNIKTDDSIPFCMMLAEKPVPVSERDYYVRIVITEPDLVIKNIKKAGIKIFVTVTDDYDLQIERVMGQEEAWRDVPAK